MGGSTDDNPSILEVKVGGTGVQDYPWLVKHSEQKKRNLSPLVVLGLLTRANTPNCLFCAFVDVLSAITHIYYGETGCATTLL